MKAKKIIAMVLAMSCIAVVPVSAAEMPVTPTEASVVSIVRETEQVTPSEGLILPRMTLFASEMYNSGLNTVSMINTTANTPVPSGTGFLPTGAYVSQAQAGIKQGNASDYSKVVTNGMATAQLLNNPLQSQYKDNTWWIY